MNNLESLLGLKAPFGGGVASWGQCISDLGLEEAEVSPLYQPEASTL